MPDSSPSKIQRLIDKATAWWSYASGGVWSDNRRTWGVTVVKTLNLSVRSFLNSNLQSQACAMTYRTVLALVPALALLFAIGRGFNVQDFLTQELLHIFPAQAALIRSSMALVDNYLGQTSEGLFVGVGVVFLLWTLISLLMSVEDTFNLVWDVKEGRSLWRKLSDYTAMLIVLPVLLLCSGGINLMLSNSLQSLLHWQFLTPLVSIFMEVGSWVLTWLFFTLSYVAIPNTRVRFLNALLAGGIAAVGFLVLQWLFVTGQLYVARYNAIYGSFSFVPLLLIWLQLVWVITIAGAVICYSSQNIFRFNFANEADKISLSYRRRVVLAIAAVVVDRFESDSPAITAHEIVDEYGIPTRLVTDALSRLERSGILSRVIVDEQKSIIGYQPAMPTDDLTVATVWERLDHMGESDFVPDFNRRFPGVVQCCDAIADTIRARGSSTLLRDLKLTPAAS